MGAVQDLFDRFIASGLAGSGTGWDLLRRREMDGDGIGDKLVVLTDDAGAAPEIHEDAGIGDSAIEDVGVLALVRAERWKSDDSFAKADALKGDVHGQRNLTINGTEYLRIAALTPEPVFVGFDDEGRPRHSIAFRLMRAAT